MLAAVDIVRQIVSDIKAANGVNALNNLKQASNSYGDTIEQRVQITAEFPNVESSDDIRNALLNLADNAYQYAYKR